MRGISASLASASAHDSNSKISTVDLKKKKKRISTVNNECWSTSNVSLSSRIGAFKVRDQLLASPPAWMIVMASHDRTKLIRR